MAGGPPIDEPTPSVKPQKGHSVRSLIGPVRARFHATPGGRILFRGLVALLGLLFVVIGLVLVPLPGPGWLIVLGGVAIWAIEFVWARHLLRFSRQRLQLWNAWVRRQSWLVRIPLLLALLAVVAVAVWLSVKHGLSFDRLKRVLSAVGGD
jgi:uncharacterized protein (TIGR02611 family)